MKAIISDKSNNKSKYVYQTINFIDISRKRSEKAQSESTVARGKYLIGANYSNRNT